MRLVVAILAGMLLALPTTRADAAPVDCEAARCTVQATIDAECPCAEAKNHGRYTSCVGKVVNRLVREGLVPKKCRSKIEGCAIRSTCGKREGTVACQLAGSSSTSRCRPLASAAACTDRGGTVVASCCDSCIAPVPTATPTDVAPTVTPVATATDEPTPVATETPAPAETATTTAVPTETATPEPVATETPGPVATETPEPVATQTTVPVATETALPTPVATVTAEPTAVATVTAVPTAVATVTAEPTAVATVTAVPTAVATVTAAPTAVATVTAVPTSVATVTAVPTAVATTTPVPTVTAVPTLTAVPTTTATPSATRTATPTSTASVTPTPVQTSTPIPTATSTPTGPVCGDGVVSGGEQCDTAAPMPQCPNSGNGLEACAVGCVCACPTKVQFSGDANDPLSVLDTGWTGIAHRAPIISNGDITIALSNCTSTTRPCGTCTVSGPIVNPGAGAGKLDNRRCSHDSSIKCTSNAQCGGANTCEFYFGGPLPLAAGGVTTCVYNQFNGPITGTANVETGEAVTTAILTSRVYTGIAIDNPCPRCSDNGGFNDGVAGGTCQGGPRNGQPCDANGIVANRPDFGRTSLDCPLEEEVRIATLPINLTNETNAVTKTLSAASPGCGQAAPGEKCMCQTCNNLAATPCFTNADCTAVGATVCGGNRCIGGTNAGAPCTSLAQCSTGGGICGRAGEPTKPSACLDDTATVGILDCVDSNGDGEGECTEGPIVQNCSVASGHAQRGCTTAADCGGAAGSCESSNRLCFLTGGGSFQPNPTGAVKVGSDTLIAAGMEDTPMNDVSNPTLGSVFCVGPTGSTSVNNVAGLPGPGRVTIRGTARGLP